MPNHFERRGDDSRIARLEVRVDDLEDKMQVVMARQERIAENQKEHRAILIGDGLEGKGGLRGEVAKQTKVLYVMAGIFAISVPERVKELVSVVAGILKGHP